MKSSKIRTGDTVSIPGDYQYKALHEGFVVQRFWHNLKKDVISNFGLPDSKHVVLDVGCGSGVISDFLAEKASSVLAIDCNDKAILFSSTQFQRENLEFRKVYFHELDLPAGKFDYIYILEVIEHLYEEQAANLLTYLQTLLTPQGRIILTTPNYNSAWPLIEWLLDFLKLTPTLAEEQHVFKVTRKKLLSLAENSNLKVTRLNKEFGMAPFLSIISWRFAEVVNKLERSISCPLGTIICAELRSQ